MEKPKVTIVMPVFNARSTLQEAISSIQAQTLQEWEMIAVDDGSTDGSAHLLEEIARTDRRIRVLHRPHRGIVAATNAGILLARSDLVARMDADDISMPGRLEAQVALAQQRPDLAVIGCLVECFSSGPISEGMRMYEAWLNSLTEPEEIAREIFVESPLVNPSVLFRREVILQLGGYREGPFPEDYDLWLRLHRAGHRMGKVKEVLFRWRDSPNRLTRLDGRYSRDAFRRLKAYHLVRSFLAGRRRVQIWGAGREGRLWRKLLAQEGVEVSRFYDIVERRWGSLVAGKVPIMSPNALFASPDEPIICAVPVWGARAEIRTFLRERSLEEGKDFLFVA